MNALKNLIVNKKETSLRNILLKINLNGKNGVFVVKSNKLIGVITRLRYKKKTPSK